jgi:hypothetical protein
MIRFVPIVMTTLALGAPALAEGLSFRQSHQVARQDLASFDLIADQARAQARCRAAGFARAEAVGPATTFCIEPDMAFCAVYLLTQTYRCAP